MPFEVSERPLGRRLAVMPTPRGQFERATTPNPNTPISVFERAVNATPSSLSRGPLLPRITSSPTTQGQQFMDGSNLKLNEQLRIGSGLGVSGPDSLGVSLMQRGMAQRAAEQAAITRLPLAYGDAQLDKLPNNPGSSVVRTRFDPSTVSQAATRGGYLPDARWEGLKQALADAGVDRVRTGARAGWDAPGFFDTQTPQMKFAYSARERALMAEMAKQQAESPYGR